MLSGLLQNRERVVTLVCLVLIGSVVGRMVPFYLTTSQSAVVLVSLVIYLLLFLTRPVVTRWLGRQYFHLYATLQMGITLVLMLTIPSYDSPQDYFAILFLPICMEAMWNIPEPHGIAWVAFLALLNSFLLTYYFAVYEDSWEGIGYSLAYTAIMILVSVFSSVTRRADEARRQTQALLLELQEANGKLEAYSKQIEQLAVIQERTRMARELHDSVSQTIFSMTLTAQSARLLLDRDPARVPQELDRLQWLTKNALAEMRSLIQQQTQEEGTPSLGDQLERLAVERRDLNGLDVQLDVDLKHPIQKEIAKCLYRIAQEALNNVVKHAGVDKARLSARSTAEQVVLEIQDQGKGFDPNSGYSTQVHLGLAGMGERVRELGGELVIEAAPGRGTLIRAVIPLSVENDHA